jgi:hypothetical protein
MVAKVLIVIFIAWLIFGAINQTFKIGKPRKPVDEADVVAGWLVTITIAAGIIWSAW